MREDQSKDLAKVKTELNEQVLAGDITTAEMQTALDEQRHDNAIALQEAEAEAWQGFYRNIRDQIIGAATEYVIQEGIKLAARKVTEEAILTSQATETTAAVTGAAIQTTAATTAATTEIGAAAATGGAKAVAAHAGIPFIGIAIGAAAAIAVVAMITKYMGLWAKGGFVTGGTKGKDSVPGLLTPGEYVLTVDQVAQWQKLASSMNMAKNAGTSNFAKGGRVAPVSNNQAPVVIQLHSTIPQSRAEIRRFVRQNIVPALTELRAQRMA